MNKKEIGVISAFVMFGISIPVASLILLIARFTWKYAWRDYAFDALSIPFIGTRYFGVGYNGPIPTRIFIIEHIWFRPFLANVVIYAGMGTGIVLLSRVMRLLKNSNWPTPDQGSS